MQQPALLVFTAAPNGPSSGSRSPWGQLLWRGAGRAGRAVPLAPWALGETPQHRKSPPEPLLPAPGPQTWGIAAVGAAEGRQG